MVRMLPRIEDLNGENFVNAKMIYEQKEREIAALERIADALEDPIKRRKEISESWLEGLKSERDLLERRLRKRYGDVAIGERNEHD